jgi:ribose transport system ATP-binding protein
MTGANDIVLEAQGIGKSFPGVCALDNVDLTLRRGRLTALLGQNGAGKSTLINILAGVIAPDVGAVRLDGRQVRLSGPRDALKRGIAVISQELSLVPHLSVAENIFLGREPCGSAGLIDFPCMLACARKLLRRLDSPIDVSARVADLRVGQQQMVEIARALATEARILILDEPTSSLSQYEVARLFDALAELKGHGVALVYITHKLEEVAQIADDISVMRDGRMVGSGSPDGMQQPEIVRLMAGKEARRPFQKMLSQPGAEVLRAEGLSLGGDNAGGVSQVDRVDLRLCRGEVLGLFGLVGAGRTELLEVLFGLHAGRVRGQLFVEGKPVKFASPEDAIAHGIAFAPEDRKGEGIVLGMSVAANASLASLDKVTRAGFVCERQEDDHIAPYLKRFRVKTASLRQPIRELSGGNQQKVILAKWIATEPKVLLLDEPTRGVDIHAKQEIYALIDELAQTGLGVIVVSSELSEITTLADHIVVLCEGRKTADLRRGETDSEGILRAALPGRSLAAR